MQQLSFGSTVLLWPDSHWLCVVVQKKNQDKTAQNSLDFKILRADVLHAPKIY